MLQTTAAHGNNVLAPSPLHRFFLMFIRIVFLIILVVASCLEGILVYRTGFWNASVVKKNIV